MIIFKEKLYSRTDDIEAVINNSEIACIDLIKCMEFWNSCPNDITHWIGEVATSRFDKLTRYDNIYGGYLIFHGLTSEFIKENYGSSFLKYRKIHSSIKSFKKKISIDKSGGNLKYINLLSKDKKGEIIWKHTNEYYETFMKYLAYLLDFQIPVSDLDNFGISEDGRTWGKLKYPRTNSL